MAVALYARVSTTRQAENDLSIPDQLRQLKEYCKSHNLAIAAEYVEPGASATDDRRPVFQQMIADATQPPAPFDAILVHSRSRFFRDLFQFLHYERLLVKVGVRVVSIRLFRFRCRTSMVSRKFSTTTSNPIGRPTRSRRMCPHASLPSLRLG